MTSWVCLSSAAHDSGWAPKQLTDLGSSLVPGVCSWSFSSYSSAQPLTCCLPDFLNTLVHSLTLLPAHLLTTSMELDRIPDAKQIQTTNKFFSFLNELLVPAGREVGSRILSSRLA